MFFGFSSTTNIIHTTYVGVGVCVCVYCGVSVGVCIGWC